MLKALHQYASPPIQPTPIPSQFNPTPFFTRMETPTDVPAFPQGQQGSSSLPPGPHSSQVIPKVRYLIRDDVLQVCRLMSIFRFPRKENNDTTARYVTQIMPSGKAPGGICERPTIPINAPVAPSNGLAPTSAGITSRRYIPVSNPTWVGLRSPVARPPSPQNTCHNNLQFRFLPLISSNTIGPNLSQILRRHLIPLFPHPLCHLWTTWTYPSWITNLG